MNKQEGCQCIECQIEPHDSDCEVHNMPALPKELCTCKLAQIWCENCHNLFTPNTDQDTLCKYCFERP